MAYTPEQIDKLHDMGYMPDWVWVQQNGRSAQQNFEYQRRKIYDQIAEREAAKRREEAKKEIEKQILEAILVTLEQATDGVAEETANDVVACINAALNGTPAPDGKKSFSAEIGAILGRALGEAPFKLLDEIFKDADERGKHR